MTFQEYLSEVHKEFLDHLGQWRLGQTYFNILYRINPTLGNHIRTTELDPFYTDGIVQNFLDYVERNWNVEGSYEAIGNGERDDGG